MKKIIPVLSIILMITLIYSCGYVHEVPLLRDSDTSLEAADTPYQPYPELTAELAISIINDFYEAKKIGEFNSVVYIYFGEDDEWFREFLLDNEGKVLDFAIEDMNKINDHLYEFMILRETDSVWYDSWAGMYVRTIEYVGLVDDKIYIINPLDFYEEHKVNYELLLFDDFYWPDEPDNSRPKEFNGKKIIQPGDPEY